MTTVERAFAAAAAHDYSGPETRGLLRMALDADHETGENCVTGLRRVHEAAGYATDPSCKSARRALKRFLADGVVRCDIEAAGVGRLFTVCPVEPWSGRPSTRTPLGRKLAAWLESNPALDVQATPDVQAPPDAQTPRDMTPDMPPDVQTPRDQGTKGPTTTSLTLNRSEPGRAQAIAAVPVDGVREPDWNNLIQFPKAVSA